ncbi:hypothetical protein [Mitsuaria sp. 7]|uniref:hypothetical protein n=1 Tax=Mitsuaria sp. 7 TaxID=1658665 RepID=UPI0007DCD23A|nr:hypothetical protein [Mitsuaria sp. 7]ANH69626.1 hypothetical protein ABE85_22270 [Mitsuaria sp. 7]
MKQLESTGQQALPKPTVVSLDAARARKEVQLRHAVYASIRESVRDIDITRGRRMAEARERAIYTY